jgi:uncharacterized protein YukJ
MRADGVDYRIAVNVLSQQAPSELLFLAVDDFQHPVLDLVAELDDGWTALASRPQTGALDFVRGNLFDPADMRPLPPDLPGPDNDLADRLEHYTQRAIADATARCYAFGQRWGPEAGKADKVFGFSPGNGVHDAHMNQGNSGSFTRDDGVWQDGALLFRFGDEWSAVFLAFQSQSWHTDDRTGHTIPGPTPTRRAAVRLIAALVDAEQPSVTLLNASPAPVELTGWSLADAAKNRHPLTGTLPSGATEQVGVASPFVMAHDGGAITLLDPGRLKIDGSAYTAAEVDEGWSVVFRR